MKTRGIATLVLAATTALGPGGLASCEGSEGCPDGEYDEAFPTGKADSPYGECELDQVVAYLNDASVTAGTLREGGIHSRAAGSLIAYRNGPDGAAGTSDDNLFESIEEVDAVAWVGPTAMAQLVAIVKDLCGQAPSIDVIFSPQPYESSHLVRVARLIDEAERSLDIAMYSMSDSGILSALERAVGRGVSVRMLFEPAREDQRSPAGTYSAGLEEKGVDVRYINKIMHHKFVIVDGPRESIGQAAGATLVTGSGNWSNGAGTKYDENTVFIEGSPELILLFQQEFNLLWENSREFTAGRTFEFATSMPVTPGMIVDEPYLDVVFTSANFSTSTTSYGPTFSSVTGRDTVSDRLVELINAATQSIHIASGHLRSRPVAEALLSKAAASPGVDIRIYLDGQEYISRSYHDQQVGDLEACLEAAGTRESAIQDCYDNGFYFSYQVQAAGIPLRFKTYCYRWDARYALQMHHKYFVFDGKILASGSYNLSDNAEHETMENMVIYDGAVFPDLVAAFEQNFAALWETGGQEGLYEQLLYTVQETADPIPIVFAPMALDWSQVTELKGAIRQACPAVDSQAYRDDPVAHQTCYR
jgi:phosphatidylserine/phosphatidylglycerophosphate/cardiolipin synthase-like enzyme